MSINNGSSCDLHAFPAYQGAHGWTAAANALMAENRQQSPMVASVRLSLPVIPLLVSCDPAVCISSTFQASFLLALFAVDWICALRVYSAVSTRREQPTQFLQELLSFLSIQGSWGRFNLLHSPAARWWLSNRMDTCTSTSCWCSFRSGVRATGTAWSP